MNEPNISRPKVGRCGPLINGSSGEIAKEQSEASQESEYVKAICSSGEKASDSIVKVPVAVSPVSTSTRLIFMRFRGLMNSPLVHAGD